MNFPFFRVLLGLAAAVAAHAHFVFVVPQPGDAKARVILSENLDPDIDVAMIKLTTLHMRQAAGSPAALTLETPIKNAFEAGISGSGTRVIYGTTDLGVMQRGKSAPHWLLYHPKTIVGNAFDSQTRLAKDTPVELIPTGKPGAVKLLLLAGGAPKPDSEITLILPGGGEKKLKTDSEGYTEAITAPGRYAVWARHWVTTPGEHNGKKYDEVRRYATLVFDAPPPPVAMLPQPTASFGAVAANGWLYIYGGHVSPTHTYFKEAVSGKFNRLRLTGEPVWEALPSGPGLQGLNLAAHNGKIYRIGGMAPQNEMGKPADNRSTAECARFDPTSGKWETLPSLPDGRSSHDVVVIGDKLIVTGGWKMAGKEGETWADSLAILDLAATKPAWTTAPQPFHRRALMAAALNGKMYVVGGITDQTKVVRTVSIYDPAANSWTAGPDLPDGVQLGFAPAAGVHNGNLYVSVADGTLLRLAKSGNEWEKAGMTTPRLAHRLASRGDEVLIVGGAAKGFNSALIEAVVAKP